MSNTEHDKSQRKVIQENQQIKERLDTVTKMNVSLKKKLDASRRKADQYDSAIEKVIQLEHEKVELMRIVSASGPISESDSHI